MNDSWETDANWIEEDEVKGDMFHPLNKLYVAQSGMSYEFFLKDGSRASLFLEGELPNVAGGKDSIRVNVGTRFYRIKLNPVVLELKGMFQTMDLRDRDYQIEITLQVSHPARFAEAYHRGIDPIYMAKKAFQGRVTEYAERTDSIQIDKHTLRYHIESTLNDFELSIPGSEAGRLCRVSSLPL